jgi:uncharacterized protein (DUF983 family)
MLEGDLSPFSFTIVMIARVVVHIAGSVVRLVMSWWARITVTVHLTIVFA